MRPIALLFALFAVACKTDLANDGVVTWYGEVEPLTQRVCANCHSENGIGPGDFTTYEGMKLYDDEIVEKLEAGDMPPPVSDPDCNPYAGSEHLTITDDERQMLLDWVAQGTPQGDPEYAMPPFEPYFEHIEDPDLTLQLPAPYTLEPDESGNQYRCFVLDYTPDAVVNVTAFDVRADNPEVVHHMLLFVDPNGDAGEGYGAPAGAKSFDCMDPIMEDDWEPLHAWAPGMPPTFLEGGHALKIERNAQIVIQAHYYVHHVDDEEPIVDQSAYLLKTTTEAVSEIQMFPGAIWDFTIPAGDPEYTTTGSFGLSGLPVSIAVHGVFPHMHLLGTRYEAKVVHADDTETCVVRGEWDFGHQMSYIFDEPLIVEPSDTLVGSCTWDNSADNPNQISDPPQPLTWGEGTDDEMCVFLTYVSIAP